VQCRTSGNLDARHAASGHGHGVTLDLWLRATSILAGPQGHHPKVANLEATLVRNEDVRGLEIEVDDARVVDKMQSKTWIANVDFIDAPCVVCCRR
jgi:hypothetical protein